MSGASGSEPSCCPVRSSRLRWLVADMDDTLVCKPRTGLFPPLTTSPVHAPLVAWLKSGGKLMVVTTAGLRVFNQIVEQIPPELRQNVVVSMCSGACIIKFTGNEGTPSEDVTFRETFCSGTTCIQNEIIPDILLKAQEMLLALFRDFRKDRTPLLALSAKYQKPFAKIVDDTTTPLEEALSIEKITTRGAIMCETNETVVERHGPPVSSPGGVHHTCTISMMGFVQSVSQKYVPTDGFFDSKGISVDRAPNSIWLRKKEINKGSPLDWMASHPEYGFSFDSAIAFGDSPNANDKPLSDRMPFVNVGEDIPNSPPQMLFVGRQEHGTAHVMELILQHMPSFPDVAPLELLKTVTRI
ncbi:hypothetical protein Pelo_12636 [Pelomyxa schiedti]|nr:hypothetical protein Pelo_12636 [Pelomyxa schiedti]